MSKLNQSHTVTAQYNKTTNLRTRISIHDKYSLNPLGFGNWIIDQYDIHSDSRILELGCGTLSMWKQRKHLLQIPKQVIFTDFSEAMVQAAQQTIGAHEHISYQRVDIQDIPFEDQSFDIVIANMMLYHVPDLAKALQEVQRVCKTDGTFYCATFGEHGIVEYIKAIIQDPSVEDKVFTLQNGAAILRQYFANVKRLDYDDALAITDIDDLLIYLRSVDDMAKLHIQDETKLKQQLEARKENNVLYIPKEYGMFICKNIT